jgi:hypothetical protein
MVDTGKLDACWIPYDGKVWVVSNGGTLRAYIHYGDARTEFAVNGGTLFTAKLTPVKDTDK